MSRLARLLALPQHRRALLLASARALLQAAWRVRRWPFSRLAATLGSAASPAQSQAPPMPEAVDGLSSDLWAAEVRWAMAAWSRTWPWPPTCLMQAVAARRLLVERGVPCDLFFGVRGHGAGQLATASEIGAHAWLRCGALTVTGETEAARFQPIAVYRFSPKGRAPQP